MQSTGDPLPSTPAPPIEDATRLLDHEPLLLSLPSNYVRGGSYQEMLSHLGHHLQDLGSILLAQNSGTDVSLATCCSTGCVPPRKDETAKTTRAEVNGQSTTSSAPIEPKVLEAMQRKIQSQLSTAKELTVAAKNEKLWELTGGTKNLPPPLSPWLRDPALNGHGPALESTCKDAGQQAPGASDAGNSAVRNTRFDLEDEFEDGTATHGHTSAAEKILRSSMSRKSNNVTMSPSTNNRKSLDMLRNVARQASFGMNKAHSQKRLLIGNGRKERQDQKKQRTTLAMEESVPLGTTDQSEESGFAYADIVVAVVILLNALVMGVSADVSWPVGWDIFEYLFTTFFLGEMIYKMRNLGIRNYFLGPDYTWNMFDFVVVTIALIDLAIGFVIKVAQAGDSVDLSKFTAVKMARLGRLARLIRLLRFKMFKELKSMIQGVFAGLRVLAWAIILFFAFIFGLAMVMRNIYMDEDWPYMKEAFGSTPWAMFTLFRCFTEDCSSHDGTPLIVHFYERYGAIFVIIYMLVFLFVTIGLFNLIMAIFVDNVMESTKTMKKSQRETNHHSMEGRLREVVMTVVKRRWKMLKRSRTLGVAIEPSVERPTGFVRKLCCCLKQAKHKDVGGESEDDIPRDENNDLTIDRELFNMIIEDPAMEEMMEQLDVSTSNRWELFDVLDADMSGHLDYEELIVGLMNLRGPTEKSDIVAALLCVRNTMQMVQDLQEDHEMFANEAMSQLSAILSAVHVMARFMLPSGDDDQGEERAGRRLSLQGGGGVSSPRPFERASVAFATGEEQAGKRSSIQSDVTEP